MMAGHPMNPRRPPSPGSPPRRQAGRAPGQPPARDQYGAFRASLLFCPTCRQATPTRERLLLVLPAGNLYEYLCVQCGTSTGSKTDKEQMEPGLILP
jgi:hypothetical protein